MTDRFKGVTVAFEHDIREDDAVAVINAIRMIRGVLAVEPVAATHGDWINREQIRNEMRDAVLVAVGLRKKDP